jgi:outer membrane lipoprotein SlyB
MNELLSLLKGIAPALATVATGPLGGALVSTIAGKFGVTDSVEAVAKAIAGDPEAALKLAEIDLKQFELENEDRASAREMQIAALQQEDWFAKNFLYVFTSVWSVFAMVYFAFVTFGTVADSGVRMADTILGVLIGTVLTGFFNFFFGSSKGSKDKTDALMRATK